MRYKESSERMSIPSVFQLKTLKDVEISVGNFTQCFSFNESDPSNIIPVKYFVYCICNISKHKIICLFIILSGPFTDLELEGNFIGVEFSCMEACKTWVI